MYNQDRQQATLSDERSAYFYDPVGNTTRIKTRASDAEDDGYVAIDDQCFAYDSLRQLRHAWTSASDACTDASREQGSLGGVAPYWSTWTYDPATGNRLSATERTPSAQTSASYTYPAAGQPRPHAVTRITRDPDTADPESPTVVEDYAHDARGNTTTRPGQSLVWDAEGNLEEVTDATTEALVQRSAYDADGTLFLRATPPAP